MYNSFSKKSPLVICHDASTNTTPDPGFVPSVRNPPQKFHADYDYDILGKHLCGLSSDPEYQYFIDEVVKMDAARGLIEKANRHFSDLAQRGRHASFCVTFWIRDLSHS